MNRIRRNGRFAKVLKRALQLAKWSQADLASHLGVSRSTVAGWIAGRSEPTTANFKRLVELFPELQQFAGTR